MTSKTFLNTSSALSTPKTSINTGKRFHLDKRAGMLAAGLSAKGADDDLLTTRELAAWLGVTPTWVEIGRSKGYGPPFLRLARQLVRYKRVAVLAWLKEREHACSAEYADGRSRKTA